MTDPFATPYDKWSVVAAFNRHGSYRCNKTEASFVVSVRGHLTPRLQVEAREAQRQRQRTRTEAVADCIRALGYGVECGNYRCITWEDAEAEGDPRGGDAYLGSNYVILNITIPDGDYVYGNGQDLVSFTDYYQTREPGSSYTRYEENRDLCGHRTLFEMALKHANRSQQAAGIYRVVDMEEAPTGVQVSLVPRDADLQCLGQTVESELTLEEIHRYCEEGARCNSEPLPWCSAVSTIGNTLPADIVEALQTFTHACPSFFGEPAYEFYIPSCMVRLPEACPCAETDEWGFDQNYGAAIPPTPPVVGSEEGESEESEESDESDESESEESDESESEENE